MSSRSCREEIPERGSDASPDWDPGGRIHRYGHASPNRKRTVSTTTHEATIGGTVLNDTAQVGRIPIRPMDSEEPHAYMSCTCRIACSRHQVPHAR